MKYIIMDDCGTDCFTQEFDTAEEAIKRADYDWNHLTNREKKDRKAFYILESINPDEEAENHYDGYPIKEWVRDGKEILTIDYNTGAGNEEALSLEEAEEKADKGACYTQKDIDIYNAGHQLVARRKWYGCMTDIELCDYPIQFGNSGFYGDWEEM